MSFDQIIALTLKISIFLIVLALGLEAELQDVTFLLRNPGLLVRSILAMNVIMPGFAVAISLTFPIEPAIKVALISLSVSPVPPLLPRKQKTAGGAASYAIGLLVAASVLAIIIVPVSIELMDRIFVPDVHISASKIISIVVVSILIPLSIGLVLGRIVSGFAARITRPLSLFSIALLLTAFLATAFVAWPQFLSLVGRGVIFLLVLFTLTGIAVGHLLGGPDPNHRTVLALATATRHPGIAIAIAVLNFPDEKRIVAAIVYYVILAVIASLPYVNWRKRIYALREPG